MRFVDTNVLLYAVSTAPAEKAKTGVARDILEADDLALSVQVLQEFYVQATRVGPRPTGSRTSRRSLLVESWLRFPVQESTVPLLRGALEIGRRHPGVALGRGDHRGGPVCSSATRCLSEDLAHGRPTRA